MFEAASLARDDIVFGPGRDAMTFMRPVLTKIICGGMTHALRASHRLLTAF
jgi:hypothetical protein